MEVTLQLPRYHCITQNTRKRGIAISIDALLALILLVALISFLGIQQAQNASLTQPKVASNQLVDDAITVLDSTGFMIQSLEDGNATPIEEKLRSLLPATVGFKVELLKYTSSLDDPSSTCRADQTFEACFPPNFPPGPPPQENPKKIYSSSETIPPGKEIFHGQKLFVKKESGDCFIVEELSRKKTKVPIAFFQENTPPEARDVNITIAATCPGPRQPCPLTDDTMRCCYEYFDQDGNLEADANFRWYKYNKDAAEGDKWQLTSETGQTVALQPGDDSNRWKCNVKVSDGLQWSQDTNSPFAIVGGPCFMFSSSMDNLPLECDKNSRVNLTLSAKAGGRRQPIDIMLSMDRSGSMSWTGAWDGAAGTGKSIFTFATPDPATDKTYFGTDSYVYELDANSETGGLAYSGLNAAIDDALGLFADSQYVYVADSASGLTILDRITMNKIRTIGSMTTAREVTVQGNYIYVAAAGTVSPTAVPVYDASMVDSPNDYERIGYSSTYRWVAQSFKPGITDINGVRLYLRRYSNPGNLTVHLRSDVNGADLPNGTATVSAASIPTSYTWMNIDFPGAGVSVMPDQNYYIAVTTTTQNSSNYYRWRSRTNWGSDPYGGGSAYYCTSSNNCTKQEGSSFGMDWFEDMSFRIYRYGYIVGGLVIINKSDPNPNNWFIEGSLYDTGIGFIDEPQDVFVTGSYAYVADGAGGDGSEGLWVIDVSDKANPAMTGFAATTNAVGVAASGNYAYVADRDSGLRVMDVQNKSIPFIAGTVGGLGTVTDVGLYDTNAYAVADTPGSGATAYGLHVIDISNPLTASLIQTFYSPYGPTKAFVGEKFAFLASSSYALTMDRLHGPKINVSRNSAKEFVSYPEWNSPEDKLGLDSYGNGAAALNHQLVAASDANKESIKTAINGLMAYGDTPMAYGVEEALDELLGTRGRAESIQFIILLADGQCNSPASCATLLNTQVQRARDSNVYIFTIGLGGDVDDAQMQNIATGAYCPEPPLKCGSYHHVSDPLALSEVYAIIAEQIAAISGVMPDGNTTIFSMQFAGFSGMQLSGFDPAPTSWDGITLSYQNINITTPWTGSFDLLIPCDYAGCAEEFFEGTTVKSPPINTTISFTVEGAEQDPVQWPEKFRVETPLYYADLMPQFLRGKFYGVGDTTLEYRTLNIGYAGIDLAAIQPTTMFHRNPIDPDDPLIACAGDENDSQQLSGVLDAAYGDGGTNIAIDSSKDLTLSDYICIWVNQLKQVSECGENNKVIVNCAIPKTVIYAMDYWAWEK